MLELNEVVGHDLGSWVREALSLRGQ